MTIAANPFPAETQVYHRRADLYGRVVETGEDKYGLFCLVKYAPPYDQTRDPVLIYVNELSTPPPAALYDTR